MPTETSLSLGESQGTIMSAWLLAQQRQKVTQVFYYPSVPFMGGMYMYCLVAGMWWPNASGGKK